MRTTVRFDDEPVREQRYWEYPAADSLTSRHASAPRRRLKVWHAIADTRNCR